MRKEPNGRVGTRKEPNGSPSSRHEKGTHLVTCSTSVKRNPLGRFSLLKRKEPLMRSPLFRHQNEPKWSGIKRKLLAIFTIPFEANKANFKWLIARTYPFLTS